MSNEQQNNPDRHPSRPRRPDRAVSKEAEAVQRRAFLEKLAAMGIVGMSLGFSGLLARNAQAMPLLDCGQYQPSGALVYDGDCGTSVPGGGHTDDFDCGMSQGSGSSSVASDGACNALEPGTGEIYLDDSCGQLSGGSGGHTWQDLDCGGAIEGGEVTLMDNDCATPGAGGVHTDFDCGMNMFSGSESRFEDAACSLLTGGAGGETFTDGRCGTPSGGGEIYEDGDCGMPSADPSGVHSDGDCGYVSPEETASTDSDCGPQWDSDCGKASSGGGFEQDNDCSVEVAGSYYASDESCGLADKQANIYADNDCGLKNRSGGFYVDNFEE